MQTDVFILGGCGHVGLPLGLVFARAGLDVGLYDLDPARTAAVQAGKMPFLEYGAQEILADVIGRRLHIVPDLAAVSQAKYVVITIGTPVDEYLKPKLSPFFKVADSLAPHLRAGQHVIVRSTVYPGTTRRFHEYLSAVDRRIQVTYCPERIAQGYAILELTRLPQIVSGFGDAGVKEAIQLFERLGCRTIAVAPEEAELAKLFLNSWRYIQFAIANQFYTMAMEANLDFFKIHHAMTWGYDRAGDFPLPGFAAGPCLLKDTMQLAAFDRSNFLLGHSAMLLNEGLPDLVVRHLKRTRKLAGERVGILGMAFKANVDDTRDSLAYKLRKLLEFEGATVLCSDEFVADPTFVDKEEVLARCNVVVIGAPHRAYRELRFPPTVQLVDPWGAFRDLDGLSPAR
jgi:UDP-N-acetyl-D-mannosaminuronic acid dehydrogenase